MKRTLKIAGIIVGVIITGLVLQLSNFSNIEFQAAEAEKPKEKTFDEYKKWATNEINKFKVSVAKLKAQLTKSDKTTQALRAEIQHMKDENTVLESQIVYYRNRLVAYEEYETKVQEWAKQVETEYQTKLGIMSQAIQKYEENQKIDETKPKAYVKDLKMNWEFTDSKGKRYYWEMPMQSYENLIRSPEPQDLFYLNIDDRTVSVRDHTKFVQKSFTKVIDELYENAGSDELFIYEVWHLISQLTIYSEEIGEDPRWALETLSRGGGDCEDTAILMADLLRSSSYTKNWKIQMVYFDMDNLTNPKSVNHVAIYIDTGKASGIIETTAKTYDVVAAWIDQRISGWWYDV